MPLQAGLRQQPWVVEPQEAFRLPAQPAASAGKAAAASAKISPKSDPPLAHG